MIAADHAGFDQQYIKVGPCRPKRQDGKPSRKAAAKDDEVVARGRHCAWL
jgi:hypothetical protein